MSITDRNGDEAVFYGQKDGVPSRFVVFTVKGVVELRLTGGNFKSCATRTVSSAESGKREADPARLGQGQGQVPDEGPLRRRRPFAAPGG